MAATYVFGEDGQNQDLTGTGGPGLTKASWTQATLSLNSVENPLRSL